MGRGGEFGIVQEEQRSVRGARKNVHVNIGTGDAGQERR